MKNEESILKAKEKIQDLFKEFNIDLTPRERFESKYSDYKENWDAYTNHIKEDKFLK